MNMGGPTLAAIKQENMASNVIARNMNSAAAALDAIDVADPGGIKQKVIIRNFDKASFNYNISTHSEAGKSNAIYSLSQKVTEVLGDVKNKTSLTSKMQDMLKKLDIKNPADSSARNEAVSSVSSFLAQAKVVSDSLDKLENTTNDKISETISTLNKHLKEAYDHNIKISGMSDERDNVPKSAAEDAILKVSEMIKVNFNVSSNHSLSIAASIGNIGGNIVDSAHYLQFSYNKDAKNPLSFASYNSSGKASADTEIITKNADGKSNVTCGGAIQGLFEFKDTILPELKSKMNGTVDEVIEGINIVHNQGVGFPPATSYTSSKNIAGTDNIISPSGSISFAPVKADGRADTMLPVKINLTQHTDVNALIREINKEGECASKAGASLGRNVDNQPGRFLIRQAALEIDQIQNGSGIMNLRLESGSDHNVKARIRQVAIKDPTLGLNGGVTAILPTMWTGVAAGDVTKFGQINFSIPMDANRQTMHIAMEIEVVGEDGTSSIETVRYTLNSGEVNGLMNYNPANPSYIQADDPAAFVAADWLGLPATLPASFIAAQTNAPVVSASISDNKLRINGQVAIVGEGTIEKQGFAKYFGLNDLIVKNADGNWEVESNIVADSNRLALAAPQKQNSIRQATLTGVNKATATLRLGVVVPGNNDTVTINNETFTFLDAPVAGNLNHIQRVAGDQQATLENLRNRLVSGSFPNISDILTVSVPSGGDMVITAADAGIAGNNISITSNFAAGVPGNNAWINAQRLGAFAVGPDLQIAATALYGGSSKGLENGGIAAANLDFNAGLPLANDVITINGRAITFIAGAPAAGANQVQIAAAGQMITDLANLLNNDADFQALRDIMNFTANGNVLEIRADASGSHANSVELTMPVRTGAHVWTNTANPGPVGTFANTTLDGGQDGASERTSVAFGWDATNTNHLNGLRFFNPITFANGEQKFLKAIFIGGVVDKVKAMVDSHEAASTQDQKVYEQASEAFKIGRHMDPNEIMLRMMRLLQNKKMLMAMQNLEQQGRSALIAAMA